MAQRRFTIIELMIAVALVTILAALAMPAFQTYVWRAKRGEIMVSTPDIADRMRMKHRDGEPLTLVPAGHPPSAPGKARRPWTSGSGFDDLGWEPDGDVYGQYILDTTTGFAICLLGVDEPYVLGTSDVDEDFSPFEVACCAEKDVAAAYGAGAVGSCGYNSYVVY